MPVGADRKRCVVVYATPTEQLLWSVELPLSATIGQALESARAACGGAQVCAQIAWDSAPVGVFGEVRARQEQFADGDRIELYRGLRRDPRERRRQRVQRERSAGRRR
ncbi:MAG TPA: RnfH family protein [Steroidobacteraceae bacterium]|nr:RnfH family protein [Steroidobacteraceae bacterium]